MKYLLLLLVMAFTYPKFSYAQRIEVNKVDDFTGNTIVRTSWEKIEESRTGTMYIQVSKINNHCYLGVKLMLGDVFSISKGSDLMFKLIDGTIITVKSVEYAITGRGDGARGFFGSEAMGIAVDYHIELKDVQTLAVFPVVKMRIYANDGYTDFNLSEKRSKLLGKTFALISTKN